MFLPPTSTPRSATSPRSARTSASGWRRSATWGTTSSTAIIAARAGEGPVRLASRTSSPRSPAVVCNKRTIESLIKAGAFDSLGADPPGPAGGARALRRRARRGQAPTRPSARTSTSSRSARSPPTLTSSGRPTRSTGCRRSPPASGTRRPCSPSSARCSGSTSPTTRCIGIEHILARHADTSIASLTGDEPQPDGTPVTVAGLVSGLQLKRTRKGDLWAIATVEDLDGAIECLFFPTAYQAVAAKLRR